MNRICFALIVLGALAGCTDRRLPQNHLILDVDSLGEGEVGWVGISQFKAGKDRCLHLGGNDVLSAFSGTDVVCVAKLNGELRAFIPVEQKGYRWRVESVYSSWYALVPYDMPMSAEAIDQMVKQGLLNDLVAKAGQPADTHIAVASNKASLNP